MSPYRVPRPRLVLRAATRPAPPPLWWLIEPVAVLASVVVLGVALAYAIEGLRWAGALAGWVIG